MTWICWACTFNNGIDKASHCEICSTDRYEDAGLVGKSATLLNLSTNEESNLSAGSSCKNNRSAPKSTRQQTLFGQAVEKNNLKNDSKPTKKRKALADNEGAKQSTLSFFTRTGSRTINGLSNRECADTTIPFGELKNRTVLAMREIFKVNKLRFLQPKAVATALKRRSQLLVMATGGGKSLCYQLPAVVLGGTTIVISPLIALMQDQIQNLSSKVRRLSILL
jgi:ATP-dependent helicase YprA (DUF1998 family)